MMAGNTEVDVDSQAMKDEYLEFGSDDDFRTVVLDRTPTDAELPLGIQVGETEPIQVIMVTDGGLAHAAGMKIGDKIMSINGDNFKDVESDELYNHVIGLLQQKIVLNVQVTEGVVDDSTFADPVREVDLDASNGIGISVIPNHQGEDGLLYGLRISEITPEGVADKSGSVFTGDQVLSINGIDLTQLEHQAAIEQLATMRKETQTIRLKLEMTDDSDLDSDLEGEEEKEEVEEEVEVEDKEEPQEEEANQEPVEEKSQPAVEEQVIFEPVVANVGSKRQTVIRRGPGGFGMKIVSGPNTEGVEIQDIIPGGSAELAGSVVKGDLILEINDVDTTQMLHEDVVKLLSEATLIKITVTSPAGKDRRVVTLTKQTQTESLGLQIRQQEGSPYHRVAGIIPNSLAAIAEVINVGDRIVEINNKCVEGAQHEAVIALLSTALKVVLIVEADESDLDTTLLNTLAVKTVVMVKTAAGFGLKLQSDSLTRGTKVIHIVEGGIADNANVHVGDVILSINDQATLDLNHDEVLALLAAAQGDVVFELQDSVAVEGATRTVVLKGDPALGISFIYSDDCEYPRISSIAIGSVAEKCELLFTGDRIVSCNNVSLKGGSHDYCIGLMQKSPDVSLVVEADDAPIKGKVAAVLSNQRRVVLTRKGTTPLGFNVASDEGGNGLIIHSVNPNSPAAIAGVTLGEVVHQINGKSALGLPHDQLVETIRQTTGDVSLTLANVMNVRQVVLRKKPGDKSFGMYIAHEKVGPARIRSIDPESTAEAALKAKALSLGDYVVAVNGTDVQNASDARIRELLSIHTDHVTLGLQSCDTPMKTVGDVQLIQNGTRKVSLSKTKPTDILGIRFFSDKELYGHIVTDVVPDSLASATASIQPGNVLVRLNGEDVVELSHKELVQKLRDATSFDFEFGSLHNIPRAHTFTVDKYPAGHGLSIVSAHQVGEHRGIRVGHIVPNGNAARAGVVLGMRLLMVNDQMVLSSSHDEALAALCSGHGEQSTVIALECDRPIANMDDIAEAKRVSVHSVTLSRLSNEALGLAIISDQFGLGARVQFVKGGGLASQSGRIAVGDKILSINGVNVERIPRSKVLLLLATQTTVKLVLKPDSTPLPQDSGSLSIPTLAHHEPHTITLTRVMTPNNNGLGIELYSLNTEQSGGYIGDVDPDGYIAQEGSLKKNDHILKIDGLDISGASHDAVVEALGRATRKDMFSITVLRKLPLDRLPLTKTYTVESETDTQNSTSGFVVFTAPAHVLKFTTTKGGADLGIELESNGSNLFVNKVTNPNGSAIAAGIEYGDEIVEINGAHMYKVAPEEALKLLSIKHTEINVHVRHRDTPPGVFILAIEPDSPAHIAGDIQPGDQIMLLDGVTPDDDDAPALQELLDAPGTHVIEVSRSMTAKPESDILRNVTLTREYENAPIGLNFLNNEQDRAMGFVVVNVISGGAASQAKLCEGDELISVNDIKLTHSMSKDDVADVFANAGVCMEIVVKQKRNFDSRMLASNRAIEVYGDPLMPNFGVLIRWDFSAHAYRVVSIFPDSPAAKLGTVFQMGDRVLQIGNYELQPPQTEMQTSPFVGDVDYLNDHKAPPFGERIVTISKANATNKQSKFGFVLASDAHVHVILEIDEQGAAAQSGLRLHDRIISVNNSTVTGCDNTQVMKMLQSNGDSVILTVARQITINVKTLTGKVNPVSVLPTDSIGDIKRHINKYAVEDIASETQQLIFAGDVLSDDVCVEDVLGLGHNATLHLTWAKTTFMLSPDLSPLDLGMDLKESLIQSKTCVLLRKPVDGFGLALGHHEGAGFVLIKVTNHEVLSQGDALLSINKQFVLGSSLDEILDIIQHAGQLLEVQVIAPSELENMRLVTLVKEDDESLGFDVVSNNLGQHRVSNVAPGSLAAHFDIPYGDRIMSVNGIDAGLLLHDELLSVLQTHSVLTLLLRTDTSDLPLHHAKLREAFVSFNAQKVWDCQSVPRGLTVYKESGMLGVRIYAIGPEVAAANAQRKSPLEPHDVILGIDGEEVSGWSAQKVNTQLMMASCSLTVVASAVFDGAMVSGKTLDITRGVNNKWGFIFTAKPEAAFMSGTDQQFIGFTGGIRISEISNPVSPLKVNNDIVWIKSPGGPKKWAMDMTHNEIVEVFSEEKALTVYVRDNEQPVEGNEDMVSGQQRTVNIYTSSKGYGLGIGDVEVGPFVSSLTPGLPADSSNQIFINDLIIRINGHSVVGKTHEEVISLIKGQSQVELVLEASQIQYTSSEQKCVTMKKAGGPLGMKLFLDQFIISCMEDSPAANAEVIEPWDKIVRVNGNEIRGNAQEELQEAPQEFEMILEQARAIALPKRNVIDELEFSTGGSGSSELRIVSVADDSAAYVSGVRVGDIVLQVNDLPAGGDELSASKVAKLLNELSDNEPLSLVLQSFEGPELELMKTTSFMQPRVSVNAPVDESSA